jgi:succinate-semialdehyde dehydrogenase/glutarate-semialdehyde dehydrogenase
MQPVDSSGPWADYNSVSSRAKAIEVRNPATGEVVGQVEVASAADVCSTVSRAREAQIRWAKARFPERARIIRRFHDLILDERNRILDTVQAETGKARRDAFAEVVTVAGTARYYLSHAGEHLRVRRGEPAVPLITSSEIVYKPHGVVGLITPWNYPFLLAIADAVPALLAGNAVVLKPSELTPLSAGLARDLLVRSGLDADLLGIIHGEGDIGQELIHVADYIGFTGGVMTGRQVAVAASERLIPFSLELGGKNPMVVLEGADLDAAANGLLAGAFSNSGQTCIAIERVYVQEAIYEQFARRVAEKTSRMKIGWSRSWDIDMGSMISAAHAKTVLGCIDRAISAGARVAAGGRLRMDLGQSFLEPTILMNAQDDLPISKEETFGPVVTLYPVRNAEEAIARANDSTFGLNASVWAGRRAEAVAVARQLETGSAAVNATLLIYNSFDVPMGGVKSSGIGRRHGEHGILRFTQAQSIVSSIATGGGYDSLLLRLRSERMVRTLVAMLKLWRRL